MNKREEKILSHEFFQDKQQLALKILELEQNGFGYLPNNFTFRIIPPEAFNIVGGNVSLGRIHDFYYISLQKENAEWDFQVFENQSKFKHFFTNMTSLEEEQISFWRHQVDRLVG